MDKEQARKLYELADRLSKLDVNTLSEEQLAERTVMIAQLQEVKQRLDPKCWTGKHKEGTKIKGGVRVNNCVPNESIEEGSSNIGNQIRALYQKIYNAGDDAIEFMYNDSPIFAQYWDEYEGDLDSIIAEVNPQELQVIYSELQSAAEDQGIAEAGNPAQQAAIAINMKKHHKKPMGEADGEYDDEAGMAQSSLQTMSRAVNGLMDTIQQGDNLPEWAQEKLSLAEDYLTTVWDYLLSQKEQGIEPKLEEASQRVDSLVTDALKLMRGSEVSDAVRALTTVLGNREYNSRRGFYNFYIKQIVDMYNKQGVAEGSLEEIDRRGFLKGMGAAAVAGAAGSAMGQTQGSGYWANYAADLAEKSIPKATGMERFKLAVMLGGQTHTQHQATQGIKELEKMKTHIFTEVHRMVLKYCELTNSYNAKSVIDQANSTAIKMSNAHGEDAGVRGNYGIKFITIYRTILADGIQEFKSGKSSVPDEEEELKTIFVGPGKQVGDTVNMKSGHKVQIVKIIGPHDIPGKQPIKALGKILESVGQGVAEAKKPSPKLTAVNIKKTDTVSEEINTEAYERLQKVFAFKNYES